VPLVRSEGGQIFLLLKRGRVLLAREKREPYDLARWGVPRKLLSGNTCALNTL